MSKTWAPLNDLDVDCLATPVFRNKFDTVAGHKYSIDHLWKTNARGYGQFCSIRFEQIRYCHHSAYRASIRLLSSAFIRFHRLRQPHQVTPTPATPSPRSGNLLRPTSLPFELLENCQFTSAVSTEKRIFLQSPFWRRDILIDVQPRSFNGYVDTSTDFL